MKRILQIEGGMGKCVAATAVCSALKKQYPDDELIVVSGHPQVFLGNPKIDFNLGFNDRAYFFQQHVQGKSREELKVFAHNPYVETDFIIRNGHLIEVWCKMFGIAYNGEQPELFINNREQGFYSHKFRTDKPILAIQTNGGGQDQPNKYSWARDMPIGAAQELVNALAPHYTLFHIRREDQLALHNTIPVHGGFRETAVLLMMAQKRLLIDSFAQHAAASLGLPSVVCWVANTPDQFGYKLHTNILANPITVKPELRHAFLSEFNIGGEPLEFPYNHEGEIFNLQAIFDALNPQPLPPVANVPPVNEEKQETEIEAGQHRENGEMKKELMLVND